MSTVRRHDDYQRTSLKIGTCKFFDYGRIQYYLQVFQRFVRATQAWVHRLWACGCRRSLKLRFVDSGMVEPDYAVRARRSEGPSPLFEAPCICCIGLVLVVKMGA